MANNEFRRFAYSDTDRTSVVGKTIVVPENREYCIYTLYTSWTEAPASDVIHTDDTLPMIQIIQSTGEHIPQEIIMGMYPSKVSIADTTQTELIVWGEHVPYSSDFDAIYSNFSYSHFPELVLSSGMYLNFTDVNSTDAGIVVEVAGLFGVRDRHGRRA